MTGPGELFLRRTESNDDGVFGTLWLPNGDTLATVEEEWADNRPRVSCIPDGRYVLRRTIYYRAKERRRAISSYGFETFEIMHVPGGRLRCLIHPANTEEDVEGCIGVGIRRGRIRVVADEDTGEKNVEKRGIVESRLGFQRFMDALKLVDEVPLEIEWAAHLAGRAK